MVIINKNFITISSKLASTLTEQNISMIEKIHSKIRLSRYIGQNLFLLFGAIIIVGYIYFVQTYFANYYILAIFLPLLICIPLMIFRNRKDNELLKQIFIYWLTISIVVMVGYLLYVSLDSFYSNGINYFSLISITLILAMFLLLFTYSLYYSSKNLSETVVRTFLKYPYIITLKLVNGDTLIGELKTITSKNDYILKLEIEDNEILVKNNSIVTLMLHNKS